MSLSMLLAVALSLMVSSVQAQNNGDIRLIGNNHTDEGRLEIFMKGKWGTFCSKNSDLSAVAHTACRQLNYTEAFQVGTVTELDYPLAPDTTPIHIGSINCSSTTNGDCSKDYSTHVLRCSVDETVDQAICTHAEDIGVFCLPQHITNHPYESQLTLYYEGHLVNVSQSSGALGIFYNKSPTIGLVCATGLNQYVADSACRQLGYTNARYFNSITPTINYTIWDGGFTCTSQSHSCLNGCFSKTPTNQTTCNSIVLVSCEFDLSRKKTASSGSPLQCDKTIADQCNPTHDTGIGSTVGIIIVVIVLIVIVAACAACITLAICCLVPGCAGYRRRNHGYRYSTVTVSECT